MGWDYTRRSIHIESKVYHLEFDKAFRGSRARIKESSSRGVFSFSLQFVSLNWLWECFRDLVESKGNLKFFKQTRCDDYSLWVEKTSNKRGNVAEVFKLDNNGHKCSFMVPEGSRREGWILFKNLIEDYPGRRVKPFSKSGSKAVDPGMSFADVVRRTEGASNLKSTMVVGEGIKEPLGGRSGSNSGSINAEAKERETKASINCAAGSFEEIEWDKTIVVTRRFFHQNWVDIISAIQQEFSDYCSISPFHPNRALLYCRTKDLAFHLCSFSAWTSVNNFQVRFDRWNQSSHARLDVVPSFGGWLKVRNLPLHLWNLETLKFVGDLCGGFTEVSPKTTMFRETMEAYIKVEGNYTGFIPAEVEVFDDSGLRFLVQIATHYSVNLLLKNVDKIHGSFNKSLEHNFLLENPPDKVVGEDWTLVKGKDKVKPSLPPSIPVTPVAETTSFGFSEKSKKEENVNINLCTETATDSDHDLSTERLPSFSVRGGACTVVAEADGCPKVLSTSIMSDPILAIEAHFPHGSSSSPGDLEAGTSSREKFVGPSNLSPSCVKNKPRPTRGERPFCNPQNNMDLSKVQNLKRPIEGSAKGRLLFSNQSISRSQRSPRACMASSREMDTDDLYSSPPSDGAPDSQYEAALDLIVEDTLCIQNRDINETGCVPAIPLIVGDEDLGIPINFFKGGFHSEESEEEGLFFTSLGEVCNAKGENKMKLGDWLNSTAMKIIPKNGRKPKKVGESSKKQIGKREIKNLESTLNYDRGWARKQTGKQVVDASC